jgi:hypothetical protein
MGKSLALEGDELIGDIHEISKDVIHKLQKNQLKEDE